MWGNRCAEFDNRLAQVARISSVVYPHINYPTLAMQTAITIGLWKSVGTLMTTRAAGLLPRDDFVA